ncbi:MAG: APC family permease [Pseudomonadota bacterium]
MAEHKNNSSGTLNRDGTAEPEEETSDVRASSLEKLGFAGWGSVERILDLGIGPIQVTKLSTTQRHKLGQIKATAICGNDITSSCLYVSALCALQAGKYAPIALGIVAVVLYLFRRIYAEVGSALPLNGGAYNVLLNTTSKAKASLAACLTLLSYIATAVISAGEAMHYAQNLWPGLHVFGATIILLAFFAGLNIMGITESAMVAFGIFSFHILTLIVLVLSSGVGVFMDFSTLTANWHTSPEGGIGYALFFGFSSAMLGISGFESSANFIEEQKEGVFPKTLRNMWIAVAVFNPLISLLSLGLIPVSDFKHHERDLLAHMGFLSFGRAGSSFGNILRLWVSVDAVLVLSGAVLTGYVGVTGLVRRMTLDRCLPQFLLSENRWRQTNHWIILVFFGLCCSILTICRDPDQGLRVDKLAGVYTLSFLGVMGLFAVGNMLLKIKRARLPRAERASWPAVVVAFLAVCAGIVGNAMDPENVKIFAIYFLITVVIVAVMFLRIQILQIILFVSRAVVEKMHSANKSISKKVMRNIDKINSQTVIFFTRGDNAANLNRAALYVRANEQTNRLKVVHVYQKEEDIPQNLAEDLMHIDRLYPDIRIDFVAVKGVFGPELIERLSRRTGVPKNYMFIGCPGDRFPHNIAELGGVRLVL